MNAKLRMAAITCSLLAQAATVAVAEPAQGTDDLGVDFYLQNDQYTGALNEPESVTAFYQRQVSWMLANDYPPASIILSSVGRGMTLADTAYFMSRAQPEEAENIYQLALQIMPTLPGWACSAAGGMPHRYDRGIDAAQLSAPTLQEVARLYFEEGKRFMGYPKWEQNQGNVDVTLEELIRFKEREISISGEDSWWYRPDQRVKTDVLMVSLYPGGERVVIDARLEQLREMKKRGAVTAPVMLLYADASQVPMSDFNRGPEDPGSQGGKAGGNPYINYRDQEISASEVITRFGASGQQASPTRDWHKGDHHLQVQVAELKTLFDIPAREDIPAADWQRWEQQLAQSPDKPLLISLYGGGSDDRWLDQRGLVAVAAEKGVERLPVVFFYHASQRQACGLPATCVDQLREAVESGSGRDVLFDQRSLSRPGPQADPFIPFNPPVVSPS